MLHVTIPIKIEIFEAYYLFLLFFGEKLDLILGVVHAGPVFV